MNHTKKLLLSLMLLVLMSGYLTASKLVPAKIRPNSQTEKAERKAHPFTSELRRGRFDRESVRNDNFNRVLVLLIDFQEDDNPLTTGNGKFLLEPDPDYPIRLGAPPHDYDYFTADLEAMRYYYLAASLGNYDIEYDIYPQKNSDFFAYTMPQEMAYYNPGMDNYRLFIERTEEYFFDVFKTADSYGEIDFGLYGHYVVIHAGSDWQSDVYGDSPSDLPSYFLRIAEGLEVSVNEGAVKISNFANVPSTVSQDDRYGVINAVLAHEFGHSIGFVDLYNVNNFYPAVGYWDLMDSGGTVSFYAPSPDNNYVIKGIPTLPSAWHRLLVWEEEFRAMGVFKEINDLPIDQPVSLSAASKLFDRNNPLPYIVRVPLTDTEYVLLENRHTDPDGDGGIHFVGAAPATPGGTDYRVILHPTGTGPTDFDPNYEYDWFLPGWISRDGSAYGGGIIAWHIDEEVIYNRGETTEAGNFYSNYDLNRINTNSNRRGVRIIEADNIRDIGNPYSWFWYGTVYEPYFRYKPELDNDGFFVRWSYNEYNRELSSVSKPALKTHNGHPSIYSIYGISSSSGVMTFRYNLEPFAGSRIIESYDNLIAVFPPGDSYFLSGKTILPVLTEDGLSFQRHFYDKVSGDDYWEDLFGSLNLGYGIRNPVLAVPRENNRTEYFVTVGNKVLIIQDLNGSVDIKKSIALEHKVVETPLWLEHNDSEWLIIPSEEKTYIYSITDELIACEIAIENARISSDRMNLFLLSGNHLLIEPLDQLLVSCYPNRSRNADGGRIEYSERDVYTGLYDPIAYKDSSDESHNAMFVQFDNGDIFKYGNESFNLFFSPSNYTDELPTQLAMVEIDELVYLIFAAGEYLFRVDLYGTLAAGYPHFIEGFAFQEQGEIRTLSIDERIVFVLPIDNDGYQLYDYTRGFVPSLSMIWDKRAIDDFFFWEEASGRLYFFFVDNKGKLYANVLTETSSNPIQWNGYRNNTLSLFEASYRIPVSAKRELTAYAFPNPAGTDDVRVRVEGGVDKIKLQLFDVSGRRLHEQIYEQGVSNRNDIWLKTADLATGIYFGLVESNGLQAKFKLAVEK